MVRSAEGEGARSVHFLTISDLYFDPMADPTVVDRLATAEPGERPEIFESSGDTTLILARDGGDSNWPLRRSALRQTKLTLPNPAFAGLWAMLLRWRKIEHRTKF